MNYPTNQIGSVSLILFLLFPFFAISDSLPNYAKLDSLRQELEKAETDSIKGRLFSDISLHCYYHIPESIVLAKQATLDAIKFATAKGLLDIQAENYDLLGTVYRDLLDEENSTENYEKAYDLFIADRDTVKALKSRGNLANILSQYGHVEEAIEIKLSLVDAFKEMHDSTAVMIEYYGVGFAYINNQQNRKALDYYLKAANYKDHPLVLGTIGENYSALGQVDSAFHYLDKALAIAKPGSGFETDILYKYGKVYSESGDFYKGIDNMEKALDNLGWKTETDLSTRIKNNLISTYLKTGQLNKAERTLNLAFYEGESLVKKAAYWEQHHKLYEAKGNYKLAYKGLSEYKIAVDSIVNTDTQSRIAEVEQKYESEKKDIEIASLEVQQKLHEANLAKQKTALLATGIGAFIFGVLSFFLFRLFKTNKNQKEALQKANAQKDTLLREIHHRVKNNLQLVSSLLTLQSRSIEDQQAITAINEGKSRVRSMALIHQDLYVGDHLTGVKAQTYLEKLTLELFNTYNIDKSKIKLNLDIQDLDIDVDTIVPLGLIINELVTNSLKYAFNNQESGTLSVSLKEGNNQLTLHVEDNGSGYDPSNINDKAFGTTLMNALTHQLSGEKIVHSSIDGTQVTIEFTEYKIAA